MSSKSFTIFAATLGSVSLLTANASELTYVVQEGDTLSTIIYRNTDNRIYGRKGALVRLLTLNPEIRDPRRIQPGTVIRLVPADSSQARASHADLAPVLVVVRAPASDSCAAPAKSASPSAARTKEQLAREVAAIEASAKAPENTAEVGLENDAENDDGFERYSLVEASPLLYFSRIDGFDPSNGSQATLLSNANVGVSARWRQVLSPNLRTHVDAGVRKEDYQETTASGEGQLHNASQTLFRVGVGFERDLSERFSLASSFSFSQQVLYRGVLSASGGVQLQPVTTPRLDAGANYRAWQGKPFRVDLEARGIALLPAKASGFSTKLGKGYSGKLALSQDFESWAMRAGLFYESVSQNTSILNLDRTESGLEMSLTWRIGSERKAK